MCTAITYKTKDRYFGRTLDYEQSFGESVVITPRNFRLTFRSCRPLAHHYAIIGMAAVAEGYPLYYDAVNENGLAMAGLMFAGYAGYQLPAAGKDQIASFELIPWVLGQCADLRDVQVLFERINLVGADFSADLPAAPLHWMVADRERSLVIEAVAGQLNCYENPVGVLTNSPPFDYQLTRLEEYRRLTPEHSGGYSRGLGAYGLPGDWSSSSRFARAAFARQHGRCGAGEEESVAHFFRLLQTVAVPKGCLRLPGGDAYTRYICCCNQDRCIYYYSTYENPGIIPVALHEADPEESNLIIKNCCNSGSSVIRCRKIKDLAE